MTATHSKGDKIRIPAGEIIKVYSVDYDSIDARSRYFSYNYGEIFFSLSISKYGTLLISGIPAYELLCSVETAISAPRREVSLKTRVQLKDVSTADRVVFHIDWDRDGVEDEVCFEPTGRSDAKIYFQSGADDSIAYLPFNIQAEYDYEYYSERWSDDGYYSENEEDKKWLEVYGYSTYPQENEYTIFLYQNSLDEYVIMIGKDLSTMLAADYIPATCFIQYEPVLGFSVRKVIGNFEYDNGGFFKDGYSHILGDTWTTRNAVKLFDDYSYEFTSDTEFYAAGHRKYTYSLQSVNVETERSTGYRSQILPAGSVIFPVKTVLDTSGKGYLYVKLYDGRTARMKVEYDAENEAGIIDGKPQDEVFVCYYIFIYQGC